MCKHSFSHRSEQPVRPEWMQICDSPQLSGDEFRVAREKCGGARRRIHVQRFAIRITRAGGDIVELEIQISRYVYHAIHGSQPWLRQLTAGQIDTNRWNAATRLQVSGWIVWIRFSEDPAVIRQRQRRYVAACASDFSKL